MRVRKLIKLFQWREQDRDTVTLGTDTRINPKTHRAQLAGDPATGEYPTTADLYVKSRLTNPQGVRAWVGFEVYVLHKTNFENAQITDAQYRLDDGTTEWYWTGATWAAAGASDWNTEEEIATNIASFGATSTRQLRVVVNLISTDGTETPELVWIKVLYECVVEFLEDIVYRSLVPLLRSSIQPIARATMAMPATGTTFNVSSLELESGYELSDVDSVFDHASDPNHLDDLLDSFAGGIVTLSSSIPKGTVLWVRFIYTPTITVTTSQDYIDVERVPEIILADVGYRAPAVPAANGQDYVANKAAGTAVVVPAPLQGDLGFTLLGLTDKAVDNQRLLEEVNAFFANNPLIWSTALDEPYRLHLIDEYEATGEPGQVEIHTGRATFLIRNFRQWLKDAYDDYIVSNFQLSLTST